jgi:hypothetical protein
MTVLADTTPLGTGGWTQGSSEAPPVRRRAVPRQQALRRPGGRPLSYSGAPAPVRVSRAPHAPTRGQVRRRRLAAWVAISVLGVAAVAGLVALRSAGADAVPVATSVVQVRAGESLSELAGRVAPGAPTYAVVERIVSLNGLSGAVVRPGESLVVPVR